MRLPFALILVGFWTPSAVAQQAVHPPACASAQHRAFDYWVGDWVVSDTTGKQIATSSITRVSAGCAIAEHWMPLRGLAGRSLSWYAPQDSSWHQQWVGGDGWIALFHGNIENGEMVLTENPDGKSAGKSITRMRYAKLPGGVVRQILWTSNDAGASWVLNFVGDYSPKED